MTPKQAAHRDSLIQRVKCILVELEELEDEVRSARAEQPPAWTEFDEVRNMDALNVARYVLKDMVDRRLLQVGRWDQIFKKGAKWDDIKRKISIEDHGAVTRHRILEEGK